MNFETIIGGEELSWNLAKDTSATYERGKRSRPFEDKDFLLSDNGENGRPHNYENDLNDQKQIFRARDSIFVDDPDADDIAQGRVVNLVFLKILYKLSTNIRNSTYTTQRVTSLFPRFLSLGKFKEIENSQILNKFFNRWASDKFDLRARHTVTKMLHYQKLFITYRIATQIKNNKFESHRVYFQTKIFINNLI